MWSYTSGNRGFANMSSVHRWQDHTQVKVHAKFKKSGGWPNQVQEAHWTYVITLSKTTSCWTLVPHQTTVIMWQGRWTPCISRNRAVLSHVQFNQKSVSQARGRSAQTHSPSCFCTRGSINVTRFHSSLIAFVWKSYFFIFTKTHSLY